MNAELVAFGDFPAWATTAAVAVVAVLVAAAVLERAARVRFRNILLRLAEAPEMAEELVHRVYSHATISRRSGVIEKLARSREPRLVKLTGLDRIWIERMRAKGHERDARRILEFCPDEGLFACFMAALWKPRVARILTTWLDRSGDLFALRKIALSGRGVEFNGAMALKLLGDRLDQIREMTGDPEWPARYFAIKIMLHSRDERSQRGVWDGFRDAHRLVRAAVANEIRTDDAERLYHHLYDLYLHDPVFEVRKAARRRLASEFADRYRITDRRLSETEALHVIELLDPRSTEDEALAFTYLAGDNLELALPAALHLQRSGALSRMFRDVTLGDLDGYARTRKLLTTAARVNVTDFLREITHTANPATLLLAAEILQKAGSRALIATLAERGFSLSFAERRHDDVYRETLAAINARGDDRAFRAFDAELRRRRADPQRAAVLLESLPAGGQAVTIDTLLALLRDPEFPCRDELHAAFLRLEDRSFLTELIEILHSGAGRLPQAVRVSAIKILGAMKLPYARQYVLENLSSMEPAEARELAEILAADAAPAMSERAWEIINGPDAVTRAAVIAVLPTLRNREFLKPIRESVHDADPQVRIAAIWALIELGDTRSFSQVQDRLRDPVERVRTEAATALGAHGTAAAIDKVREVLADEHEVEEVKHAAIAGLGRSEQKRSIDVLVELLGRSGDRDQAVVETLASKQTTKQIAGIVEHLKDAEPRLREKLMRVFRMMGPAGEQAMVELLREDISSLRPLITEILEETGYVEATIRNLAHRDPEVRREAAGSLAAIGTLAAFRGIVAAARDPDPEVRVRVTRALEKLSTDSGTEILEKLQSDPDRKVRRYTLWALERYKAKKW